MYISNREQRIVHKKRNCKFAFSAKEHALGLEMNRSIEEKNLQMGNNEMCAATNMIDLG